MESSTVTKKGQATIPQNIRKFIGLKPGDKVAFIVDGDRVVLSKADVSDGLYLASIQNSLADEWLSDADCKAYDDL